MGGVALKFSMLSYVTAIEVQFLKDGSIKEDIIITRKGEHIVTHMTYIYNFVCKRLVWNKKISIL